MTEQEEDVVNGNAMTSDRFKDLVYDFWVSSNPERYEFYTLMSFINVTHLMSHSKGKYICGPFDQSIDELELKIKKRD